MSVLTHTWIYFHHTQHKFTGANTFNMSGTELTVAAAFKAPWTGTIDRIAVPCTSVTSPPVYDVRLVEVGTETIPTTLKAANTNKTFTPTANTIHELTLNASYNVTVGESIGVRIIYDSGTIGVSNNATFHYGSGSTNTMSYPNCAQSSNAGTSWTYRGQVPTISPIYSDGRYFFLSDVHYGQATVGGNVNSTPDEWGMRFKPPRRLECIGLCAVVIANVATTEVIRFRLYDASDNTVLKEVNAQSDKVLSNSSTNLSFIYFDGPVVTLNMGQEYIVSIIPQGTTSISIASRTTNQAAFAAAAMPVVGFVSRTDSGDWSAPSFTAMPVILPVFSNSDFPPLGSFIHPLRQAKARNTLLRM